MNELDLPTPPPLPAEVRERALDTVLDGIDAPGRRRTAPLVAAAVVVMVLGAATATALSRPPSPAPSELAVPPQPASNPSIVAPAQVEPDLPAPPEPSGDPAPPDTGTGYQEPLVRCKAAVTGSGRADEYPDVAGWTITEHMPIHEGVDTLLAIDNAFICFASPTTVRVSQTAGVPVGGVEVVRVGPELLGVLNPHGASVSWAIGTRSSFPSTAPVQAVQLEGGVAPADVQLTVVGADSTGPAHVEPLPESAPDPIVVTDHPRPARDSTTVDGAALDDCVVGSRPDPSFPDRLPSVTGESEPELWQPLTRFDLPGGGFALSATIGEDYAGLCVRNGDYRSWSSRTFRSVEWPPAGSALLLYSVTPASAAADLGGYTPPIGGLFGLGPGVARVELTTADGTSVPCEVRSSLALCVGDVSGPANLTLFNSDGAAVLQMPNALENRG